MVDIQQLKQLDNKMTAKLAYKDRAAGALYGMFIGDALAMPAHWYYNTEALEADYGLVTEYMESFNSHPDSILWRSSYSPRNKSVDILHDQSQYWGKRGIHDHPFLRAGKNTLNLKLVRNADRFSNKNVDLVVIGSGDLGHFPEFREKTGYDG